MSALEQSIWDMFQQLDEDSKLRLLKRMEETTEPDFDFDAWMAKAEALHQQLREKYGTTHFFDVQGVLDELREEASWPRW